MEKEQQPDSITIKADYPPSEIYSSEPPPAYHRHQAASVQVAKIIAVTVVLVSVVLGGFLLASAYVTANASCRQLEQELQLLSETADRLQSPLQPEALIQEESKDSVDTNRIDDSSSKNAKELQENASDSDSNSESSDSDEEERVTPVHIKLPLQLNLNDLTGAMLDKNQRSKMNCVVEKKRAEEVVDHQPKTVRLPFGVNLTTDPRYEHITGERMVIVCESGTMQSHEREDPEDQEETVMIQPVVIPISSINPFQTHMQQQMRPSDSQQQQMPTPMETLRPPMINPMMQQQQPQSAQQHQSPQLPPNIFLQHIAQQIIESRIRMQMQRAQEEAKRAAMEQASQREDPRQEYEQRRLPNGDVMMAQRIPIPEEVLRQINRLPNHEVIVSVSEQEPDDSPQEMRIIQHPRQSAQEMNGKQSYARDIPVHIPVPMMHQVEPQPQPQQQQPEQPTEISSEELRPHYVQPRSVRSVRSVEDLIPNSQKRVKRCACDCAC